MSDHLPMNGVARESNTRLPMHFGDGNFMQQMFQLIFFRMAVIYSQSIPKHGRRFGEMIILLMALSSLSLLIYVHLVFNQRPLTCLTHLKDDWPRHGVIRVELFLQTPPAKYDLQRSYDREYRLQTLSKENLVPTPKKLIEEISENKINEEEKYSNKSINTSESISNGSMKNSSNNYSIGSQKELQNKKNTLNLSKQSESTFKEDQSLDDSVDHDSFDGYINNLLDLHWLETFSSETRPILEYSSEYGILRLIPTTRKRLNIEVLYVKLDLSSDTCFGNGLTRFLLDHLIGYEEILISSLKQVAEKEINKGYVRNVLNNNHYRFVSISENNRLWTYSVAFLVMVLFTITISMLLRYSHFQIFVFIVSLLNNFEQNVPIRFPIPPLLTVILALIGMEALMSEFFNDATTGFYIILLVWTADQYNSICCHRPVSKHHWVRFFLIYHFIFYAYHARYNGQYSGLALSTSCFFILHSMFYIFHHIELPAIEAYMISMMSANDPPNNQSSTTQTTAVYDST